MNSLRALLLFLLVFAAAAPAQQTSSPDSKPNKEKIETSEKQADELFHEMNSILEFVSDDTKLPIKHPVKHKLVGRDEVEKNTDERLKKDKDTKRLEKAEIVLKKFGLIPRDFHLRTYLVSLLKEQVAGFYNTKDKTMYLLNWIPAYQQLSIMSHELTHALEDQNVYLEKWLRGNTKDADDSDDPTIQIRQDEEETAREAVAEGQGMVVMIDYLLKDSGRTALQAPYVVQAMKDGMMNGGNFPEFEHAPVYLQESLSFPYTYGLDFIENLLVKGGKKLAYDTVMSEPPVDTRQIMDPKTYLNHEPQQPLQLPQLKSLLGKDYESYDSGSVGEFDVMVLLKQFSGGRISDRLYPEWRGGGYWAFQTKDAHKSDTPSTKSVALLYFSRWSSPEAAERFAREYGKTLAKRYASATLEAPSNSQSQSQPSDQRWQTDEGLVVIQTNGNMTLALESFDPQVIDKVSACMWTFEAAPDSKPAACSAR